MKTCVAALALAAVLACPQAQAEGGDWLPFHGDGAGTTQIALHTGRMSTRGKVVTAWLRWEFSEPETIQGEVYDSSIEKREVDCATRRTRVLQDRLYGKGAALELAPSPWKEVPPGVILASVVDFVCDHPPFSGWMDDPDGDYARVTKPERRGRTLTRWVEKWDEDSKTVFQIEYDCKNRSRRLLYGAPRTADGTGYKMSVRFPDEKWTPSVVTDSLCPSGKGGAR